MSTGRRASALTLATTTDSNDKLMVVRNGTDAVLVPASILFADGTQTASLYLSPPTGLRQALNLFQDPRTTAYTLTDDQHLSFVLNNWQIGTSDRPDAVSVAKSNADKGAFGIGINFRHYVGGPTMRGGREGLVAEMVFQAPSATDNSQRNYTPFATQVIVASHDGGTSPNSLETAKGAMFGASINATALPGSINLLEVTGGEVNVAMQAGSSAYIKAGWSIVGRHDDAVQGTGIDAILLLSNQGTAIQWNDGILFSNSNGRFPIQPNGTLLRVGAANSSGAHVPIGNGIDLTYADISGAAYRSSGFVVDGFGNLTAQNVLCTTMQQLSISTVANIPNVFGSASPLLKGRRGMVSDALNPTFMGTLTGGGSVVTPIFCNGSAWVAG